MSYYTGVVTDMGQLRAALTDACVQDGWDWDGSVLSKGPVFVRLEVTTTHMSLLGRTSIAGGDAPGVVQMGPIGGQHIQWPLTYYIFSFDQEVYMVINYAVDRFQWVAFGVADMPLPGTGGWLAAPFGSGDPNTQGGIAITASSGAQSSNQSTSAAPFWNTTGSRDPHRNCWVYTDVDDQGWWLAQTETSAPVGVKSLVPLIGLLPNSWNSEAILLPIRCYKVRPSLKASLVLELKNARFTRINNYEPGQVISIGPDSWMVFPFYRKNTDEPDGAPWLLNHTGTFGWAIRYEGP